jgi:hypothetical protein
MSKSKKMFEEQREKDSETLGEFLDDNYREAQYHKQKHSEVLNEIFVAWSEIFSPTSKDKLKSKSSEGDNF